MLSTHRSPVRLVLAAVAVAALAPVSSAPAHAAYGDAAVSTAQVVVPMTFPVIGPTSYSDTYLACRSGCSRQHFGQDLMGPKMRMAVAAFNGVVHSVKRESYVGEGNYITLRGDNGWSANYIHMNNDTPGTDDGKGTAKYFLAPGVREGKRVFAGELLGWVGDSGNAESTGPHLHFELRKGDPWSGTVYNAFHSLNAARRLSAPTTSGPHAEGTFIKACATCAVWELDRGKRRHLLPEVAKELRFDPRTAVTVTANEAKWYPVGPKVALPGGRAYQAPDGKVWFVTKGVRYRLATAAARYALRIPASRVRPMTYAGILTVPLAPTWSVPPIGITYEGALLRVPGTTTQYWHVAGGVRRLVDDAMTLRSWGLRDVDAIKVPEPVEGVAAVVLPPLGTPLPYKDGAVIRDAAGRKYLVSNGTKRRFPTTRGYAMYGFTNVLQQTPPAAVFTRLPTAAGMP